MKTSDGILMVEPSGKASAMPVVDELTRKMTAAWHLRRDGKESYRGFHSCVCGVHSSNKDHWVCNEKGLLTLTNSLCVHYLAFHRGDISQEELDKVRALLDGELEPTVRELKPPQEVVERRHSHAARVSR